MNGIGGVWEAPDALKLDAMADGNLNDRVQTVIKSDAPDELMRNPHLYEDGWDLVHKNEFAITEKEDGFNLVEAVSENLRKIIEALSVEERKKYILVQLYEDKWLLNDDENQFVDIDWSTGNVQIHDGDILKVHTLEIYLDTENIEKILKQRKEKNGNKYKCPVS